MQAPIPESPFQLRDTQLIAKRELANIFDAETKIPNRDALLTPTDLLTKNRDKLPRVEDQIVPPRRVDPYGESNNREQKLTSPIKKTPP